MQKSLLLGLTLGLIVSCSDENKADKHPAKSSFDDSTAPKKIASKPCSNYNLKFYEGDDRDFEDSIIHLGDSKSDAQVEVNDKNITILGFEGQAEEYINYSMYRGTKNTMQEHSNGSTLSTNIEMQIIICFRKNVIAVKQMIENVRARGEFSKSNYLTKQWIWRLKKD
jgi:hypothetical protein